MLNPANKQHRNTYTYEKVIFFKPKNDFLIWIKKNVPENKEER